MEGFHVTVESDWYSFLAFIFLRFNSKKVEPLAKYTSNADSFSLRRQQKENITIVSIRLALTFPRLTIPLKVVTFRYQSPRKPGESVARACQTP